jgi:hypothetical protein
MCAKFHPFDTLRVHRFEVRCVEALDRGAGEDQSGNNKEGEDTHTFILRGYRGFAHGGMMVLRFYGGGCKLRKTAAPPAD